MRKTQLVVGFSALALLSGCSMTGSEVPSKEFFPQDDGIYFNLINETDGSPVTSMNFYGSNKGPILETYINLDQDHYLLNVGNFDQWNVDSKVIDDGESKTMFRIPVEKNKDGVFIFLTDNYSSEKGVTIDFDSGNIYNSSEGIIPENGVLVEIEYESSRSMHVFSLESF